MAINTNYAYSGYNKAGDYTRCLCWAHGHRYYIESIPLDDNGKEIQGSKGDEGREYINLLFKVEKETETSGGITADSRCVLVVG